MSGRLIRVEDPEPNTLWVHSISLLCSVYLHLRQPHPSIMVHSFLLLGSTLVTGLIGTQIEDTFYFILFYFYQELIEISYMDR